MTLMLLVLMVVVYVAAAKVITEILDLRTHPRTALAYYVGLGVGAATLLFLLSWVFP